MKLVLTGGFLGSGKTTAIVQACQHLMANGRKVAVITNDQGNQQVDSLFTKSLGITTREVSNGCFCCRYDELDQHLQSLVTEYQPEIIFAESVGSCTDLIATIQKPLHQFRPDIDSIVSVFADASMLSAIIEGRSSFLEESVRYIYKKQLEEADVIVLNKIDLVTAEQLKAVDDLIKTDYPGKIIMHQNSLHEKDIISWLNMLNQFPSGNRNSLTLDYDLYGEGEAKMAWLDKSIGIHSPLGNGGFIARQIILAIFNQLRQENITIGHLKFFMETEGWSDKISVTTANTSLDFKIWDANIKHLRLLINARVQSEPSTLQLLIDKILDHMQEPNACVIATEQESAFKPSYPRPTHRMV